MTYAPVRQAQRCPASCAKRPWFPDLKIKMNARAPFGVSVSWRFRDAMRRMPGWVLTARR
jgi:hypothetical protein